MDAETRDGPPRALLIAAIVVAAGAIIGILVFAALRQSPPGQQTVAIASVPAPKGDSAECRALLDALPEQLGEYRRAPAAQPAPPGAAAWTADGEPIILRCGVDRPAEFVVGSPIQVVDAVQWFGVAKQGRAIQPPTGPQYVVRGGPARLCRVDIAAGIRANADSGVSDAIAKSLPAKPIDPAPVGCASVHKMPPQHGVSCANTRARGDEELTQCRCRAAVPSRPWSPAASDSPRRWPPTSVGTSRSW